MNLSLRARLFINFIAVALIVLLISSLVNYLMSSRELEKSIGANISKSAAEIVDKIDRNLFERYGDVQAYQYNKVPSLENRAYNTAFMNSMMQYYNPIYLLMIMTDRQGRVVAVNTIDGENKPVETGYLIGKDFSQSTWFKTVASGEITAGKAFVEDPAFDEDVKRIFPAHSGYAMNFSSPVYDGTGNIVGAWTNRMDVDNINQIILDNLESEKAKGLTTAEVKLFSKTNGTIYDKDAVNIGKKGEELLSQEALSLLQEQEDTFRVQGEKLYGVAKSKGFSSYPSRNWGIIFSVDYSDAMKGLATIKYANMGIFVLALLITVVLTLFATKSIVAPIEGLVYVAQQVSDGDLASDLPETFLRSDKRLAEAFSQMMCNLRSLVTHVQDAVNQVAAASEELSENASQTTMATQHIAAAITDLTAGNNSQVSSVETVVDNVGALTASIAAIADGAAEQLEGIEKTDAIIGEMAGGVGEVREKTELIAESAGRSTEAANSGSSAVEDTISGMHRIKDSVFETAAKIRELGRQSDQIGEIVQVIDDIAEQTNLLALNAAIEAARAGEHGKGFAVVADEVRKLAERSGKATKEIAQLISSIQSGTNNAVAAMDRGTNEVEDGVILAEKAGAALKQILENINETKEQVTVINQLTQKVAAQSSQTVQVAKAMKNITRKNIFAAEEMSAGSKTVNESIVSISAITTQNAASAEEVSASTEQMNASIQQIASSAQQLSGMAGNLRKEATKFRV